MMNESGWDEYDFDTVEAVERENIKLRILLAERLTVTPKGKYISPRNAQLFSTANEAINHALNGEDLTRVLG